MCSDIIDDCTVHSTLMSSDGLTSAIKKLKPGKSDGYDGLSSFHYCNGFPLMKIFFTIICLSLMTETIEYYSCWPLY